MNCWNHSRPKRFVFSSAGKEQEGPHDGWRYKTHFPRAEESRTGSGGPRPEEIDAKKLANQRIAQRFVMPFSADQTRLTFEAYPDLESAYNGTLVGELDLRSIRVISPEKVERAAGPYLDPARDRAIARDKAVREANDPVRAVNRAIANAWRGRNFDQSKG